MSEVNKTDKNNLNKTDVTCRLYSIKNIVILAAYCDENKVEAYHLQGVASHIADMIDDLIEDIGA